MAEFKILATTAKGKIISIKESHPKSKGRIQIREKNVIGRIRTRQNRQARIAFSKTRLDDFLSWVK